MSWAYSEDPDTINEVSHWPCREHQFRDEAQVPTQYDLASKQWGYLVPRDSVPLRWFKLLLLEEKDVKEDLRDSEYLRDARRQLQRFDSDGVIDVIADFLRELWAHALEEIKVQIDIDLLRFRVALTVPAIWPQYAKQKMKEAAKRAGILAPRSIGETTLVLVEEPEAAAVATLLERKKFPEIAVSLDLHDPMQLVKNKSFFRELTLATGRRSLYRLRLRRRNCGE